MVERRFPPVCEFGRTEGSALWRRPGGPAAGQDALAFGPDLTVIAPGRISLSLFAGPAGAAGLPAGELRELSWCWLPRTMKEVNRAIAAEARARGALANNASDCRDCDFSSRQWS